MLKLACCLLLFVNCCGCVTPEKEMWGEFCRPDTAELVGRLAMYTPVASWAKFWDTLFMECRWELLPVTTDPLTAKAPLELSAKK